MNKNIVINALSDMKRQIEEEGCAVFITDRGSGSGGPNCLRSSDAIDEYLFFAVTGDNGNIPACQSLDYIPLSDFTDYENDVVSEILYTYPDLLQYQNLLGLVVAYEHFDFDYYYYMVHLDF